MSDDPVLWFVIFDELLAYAKITSDDSKYVRVLGALPPQTIQEVRDIIINKPPENAYKILKGALISRLSSTREAKLHQLLEREEMGDLKPSQFLRHLQELTGTEFSALELRTVWMSRLPAHVQSMIMLLDEIPVEKLATIADKLMNAAAVTNTPSPAEKIRSDAIDSMVATLTVLMKKLTTAVNRSRASSRSSRSRSQSSSQRARSPSLQPNETALCWYHAKFGDEAVHCIQPCRGGSVN